MLQRRDRRTLLHGDRRRQNYNLKNQSTVTVFFRWSACDPIATRVRMDSAQCTVGLSNLSSLQQRKTAWAKSGNNELSSSTPHSVSTVYAYTECERRIPWKCTACFLCGRITFYHSSCLSDQTESQSLTWWSYIVQWHMLTEHAHRSLPVSLVSTHAAFCPVYLNGGRIHGLRRVAGEVTSRQSIPLSRAMHAT